MGRMGTIPDESPDLTPAQERRLWRDFARMRARRGPATPEELARLHTGIESAKTAPERLRRLIAELDESDRRAQQQGDQPPTA